jgi:hypothetical protein
MVATNTWAGPIPLDGAKLVQVRDGGPILVCVEEPEDVNDGFLIPEGGHHVFTGSPLYNSIWIRSRRTNIDADVYIGGTTIQG